MMSVTDWDDMEIAHAKALAINTSIKQAEQKMDFFLRRIASYYS